MRASRSSGLGLGSMYGLLALGFHVTLRRLQDGQLRSGRHHDAGRRAVLHLWVTLGWPLGIAVVSALLACAPWGVVG